MVNLNLWNLVASKGLYWPSLTKWLGFHISIPKPRWFGWFSRAGRRLTESDSCLLLYPCHSYNPCLSTTLKQSPKDSINPPHEIAVTQTHLQSLEVQSIHIIAAFYLF
ncbi:hypothetical protein AG1IA_07382 [Rhizoctonia solani AG-1 IA]|uniref:Uncharacterized protein n=1 Tax=Thanatephorus cucumeris (strain AG1-IA) TaxID=983506 RepID=L8WQH0_THACA|nr:hypothetical protein AG1IA_07382 [Rhizoctonia solani AG-1 IA]